MGAGSTSSVAAAMRKDVITFPPPLQRGGRRWGPPNQLRPLPAGPLPPLAKGGPGGVGAGSTSSVRSPLNLTDTPRGETVAAITAEATTDNGPLTTDKSKMLLDVT